VLADGVLWQWSVGAKGGSATSDIRQNNRLAPGLRGLGKRYARPARLSVPPNRFGVPLGLAGLATAWHAAGPKLGTSPAVPDAIDILAGVVLLILGWLYAAQGPRRVLADLRHPVLAPFVAVPAITAMMLAAALASVAFAAGRALVVIFLAVTVGLGAWLVGRRMMDAEVEQVCGAGRGKVGPGRVNSRNGYRRRE
jgi:hypothetical protein